MISLHDPEIRQAYLTTIVDGGISQHIGSLGRRVHKDERRIAALEDELQAVTKGKDAIQHELQDLL